jgi:hypothetical protein
LFERSVVDSTIVDRSNVDEKAHMFDLSMFDFAQNENE